MRIFLAALVLVALAACGTQGSDTPAARSADVLTATPGGDPPDKPAIEVNFVGAEALTGETRSALAELVERIHPAIVQVVAGSGGGSGFIVNPNGLLITNSHVVNGFDRVEVILPDGSRYGGEVLARDDGRDLATVRIQGGGPFAALTVGDAAAMRLGDEITVPSLVVGDNEIVVTVTVEDTTTLTSTIAVTRATDASVIPSDWSLKPLGLSDGDKFRPIFLSSMKRNANPTTIATYDTFIQDLAAAGHTDIQAYSDGFHVVGCTGDTDARDNTEARHMSADRGVPIYWLNGVNVADDYQDFYDGAWDDENNEKNESGNDGLNSTQTGNYAWTGCAHNGTERFSGSESRALGTNSVTVGRPGSAQSNHGPIGSSVVYSKSNSRPMYGLSGVFQVEAATTISICGRTLAARPRNTVGEWSGV